jgi:dihydroxyacetone kinase DhaKLM complex PTS-EIIA-like component DhaM
MRTMLVRMMDSGSVPLSMSLALPMLPDSKVKMAEGILGAPFLRGSIVALANYGKEEELSSKALEEGCSEVLECGVNTRVEHKGNLEHNNSGTTKSR